MSAKEPSQPAHVHASTDVLASAASRSRNHRPGIPSRTAIRGRSCAHGEFPPQYPLNEYPIVIPKVRGREITS